jgi:hypothetical protein
MAENPYLDCRQSNTVAQLRREKGEEEEEELEKNYKKPTKTTKKESFLHKNVCGKAHW